MELRSFLPNAGRMPALDCLPTLIQLPVTKLEKLPCVAGVISGKQQGLSITLFIFFNEETSMQHNYKAALDCFAAPGISVKALSYDPVHFTMSLTISHSKILLN